MGSPLHRPLRFLTVTIVLLAPILSATPLRVATMNIELGLEGPGALGHDSVTGILNRIKADVVALQEVRSQDLGTNLDSLAATTGYPHLYVSDSGPLDTNNRIAILSRHPITSSISITSPPGATDVTRTFPAVEIDVPGTLEDPTIISLHLKCCFETSDPFRRAVELDRISDHLASNGLSGADNVIILGDTNLLGTNTITFNSLPFGLPASYRLGSDITFPVEYSPDPAFYFTAYSFERVDNFQADGVSTATQSSGSVLDHIVISPALSSRPHATEIYNSALETTFVGLPKAGSPLPAGTSNNASDHFAVFGDFELETAPSLTLSVSPGSVSESDPSGSAALTITLPAAPGVGESIEVALTSSDPGEAIPTQVSITFTPGVSSLDVDVASLPDALLDGSQPVTFTATASGFRSADALLEVTDVNLPRFAFSAPGQTLFENFDTFDGSADPARWPTGGGSWNGLDDGTSSLPGNYAYGSAADPALGFLLDGTARSSSATFRNDSGNPITALEIAYRAEQWRSTENGGADQFLVELIIEGTPSSLPPLTFTADTSLPSGPIAGGTSSLASTVVSALSIPPGSSFSLRFTVNPGPGGLGTQPDDVFLNELHYDNSGGDSGEFVEVVVGPGYTGQLFDLSVILYNGNNGATYDAVHSLDTFAPGTTTPSGHRFFSKLITGIQNGSPDGLAVVANGSVLHFLSYEGSFTATNGPANGLTSSDLGVAQPDNSVPIGEQSLILTGTGGAGADFAWIRSTGLHTPGSVNEGQVLAAPVGAQGIAIDDLSVTFLTDTDLDGLPDLTDLDDDNDGLPDSAESLLGTSPILVDSDGNGTADGSEDFDLDRQSNLSEVVVTLTDPLDPNSRLQIVASEDPGNQNGAILSFPTLAGRSYAVERSHDLVSWAPLSSHPGTGAPLALPVSGDPAERGNFFRIVASIP